MGRPPPSSTSIGGLCVLVSKKAHPPNCALSRFVHSDETFRMATHSNDSWWTFAHSISCFASCSLLCGSWSLLWPWAGQGHGGGRECLRQLLPCNEASALTTPSVPRMLRMRRLRRMPAVVLCFGRGDVATTT